MKKYLTYAGAIIAILLGAVLWLSFGPLPSLERNNQATSTASATNNNDQGNSEKSASGDTKSQSETPAAAMQSTDIFFGIPLSAVSDSIKVPGTRYKIQVNNDVTAPITLKGNASGVVVVNATNPSFIETLNKGQSMSGARFLFETAYDPVNDWYNLISVRFGAIVD